MENEGFVWTNGFRIYGKYGKQKRFKPMDLKNCRQVTNLIYADILPETEANKILEEITRLNPDWQFEKREINE